MRWLQRSLALALLLLAELSPCASLALRERQDGSPTVCMDAGVDFAFPLPVDTTPLDWRVEMTARTCLRRLHPMMSAMADHLTRKLPHLAVTPVDCVGDPIETEDASSLFAVFSVCSRANIERTSDEEAWMRDVQHQIRQVCGFADGDANTAEAVELLAETRATTRTLQLSEPFALSQKTGIHVPRLELHNMEIWSDRDEDIDAPGTSGYVTFATLELQNGGSVPLHLYRVTLDRPDNQTGSAITLSLDEPAVVKPMQTSKVTFAAKDTPQISTSQHYAIYVSHSGVRAHRFEGAIDGKRFVSNKAMVESKRKKAKGNAAEPVAMSGVFGSFQYVGWRVYSVGIVVVVGIVATLFMRRKWSRVQCRRSLLELCRRRPKASVPMKSTKAVELSAMEKSDMVNGRNQSTESEEYDQVSLETETLLEAAPVKNAAPVAPPMPAPSSFRPVKTEPKPQREKMPAITMQWKRPPAVPKVSLRPKPLTLESSVQLHPKRFESMWDEYIHRYESNFQTEDRPESAALIKALEEHSVLCMASGTVNGVDKYVFYAKQRGSVSYFLLVVDITFATNNVSVTLRTSSDASDQLVQEFVQLTLSTLQLVAIPATARS